MKASDFIDWDELLAHSCIANNHNIDDKELFEGTHEAIEGLTIRGEK